MIIQAMPYPAGATGAHRYWGISIDENVNGVATNAALGDLQFFDAFGAMISRGLTGYAKAGWTSDAAQAASTNLTDERVGGSVGNVAYEDGDAPLVLWVDFGSPAAPALMRVVGIELAFIGANPADFSMVYSDDALAWTSVASASGVTSWKEFQDRVYENPGNPPAWTGQQAISTTQIQIRLDDYYDSYFGFGMSELLFYETIGGAPVVPSSITASSTLSGYPPDNLIDGSSSTLWTTNGAQSPRTVTITATFASSVKIAEIGMRARSDADSNIGKQMPNDLLVSYWDGSAFRYMGKLLDPAPSWASPGELRKYPLLISQ